MEHQVGMSAQNGLEWRIILPEHEAVAASVPQDSTARPDGPTDSSSQTAGAGDAPASFRLG